MIIDPKSHVPIYRQIVEQVRLAIEAGVHRPGECLPSQRSLALELHVNPNTIQRAYEELERSGVVEVRRGVGMFVVNLQEKAARNGSERKIVRSLVVATNLALKANVSPERLRELFEGVISSSVAKQQGDAK